MCGKPILSEQDIHRILSLREKGLSWERIAEEVYVSRSTVSAAIKRYQSKKNGNT